MHGDSRRRSEGPANLREEVPVLTGLRNRDSGYLSIPVHGPVLDQAEQEDQETSDSPSVALLTVFRQRCEYSRELCPRHHYRLERGD